MKTFFITIMLAIANVCLAVQPADSAAVGEIDVPTKQAADALYEKEQYSDAAKAYETIIAGSGTSADIYYNLGNCYYKLSDVARAILNYERALLLNQGDSDIRTNLAIARGKTVDKVTPASEMFFVAWWRDFVNMMSIDMWAVVAIITFVLMLVGILAYMYVNSLLWRKIGVYGAMAMLVVSVLSNVAAAYQRSSIINRDSAVVMQPVVTVKSSPSLSSTDLFLMHSGSKVEILDNTMKEWVEVKFEEGKEGWIPVEAIEVI